MSTHKHALTVSFPHADPDVVGGERYRIEKVFNSTEYAPGRYLTRGEVDELCKSRRWNVTAVPPPATPRG